MFKTLAALQWKATVTVARKKGLNDNDFQVGQAAVITGSQHTACNCVHRRLMERDPNYLQHVADDNSETILLRSDGKPFPVSLHLQSANVAQVHRCEEAGIRVL